MIEILHIQEICQLIYLYSNNHSLLDINRDIHDHKRKIINIELKCFNSVRYAKKKKYRKYINSLVDNTKLQLSLTLRWSYNPELKNVTNKELNYLNNIKVINFRRNFYIKDVNKLNMCTYLNLEQCENVSDVSELGNLFYLDLTHTKVADVSKLGNVNFLNLRGCDEITDFSMLENVHYLDLSSTKVSDISHFKNVHTLILNNCLYITDISNLSKSVKVFRMYGNENIVNVSSLKDVTILYLIKMPNVVDISMLGNVKALSLSDCNGITDVSQLGKVSILYISNLRNLQNNLENMLALNSLTHDTLTVTDCPNINDIHFEFDYDGDDTLSKDQVKWMKIPSSYHEYNGYNIKEQLKESRLIRIFD